MPTRTIRLQYTKLRARCKRSGSARRRRHRTAIHERERPTRRAREAGLKMPDAGARPDAPSARRLQRTLCRGRARPRPNLRFTSRLLPTAHASLGGAIHVRDRRAPSSSRNGSSRLAHPSRAKRSEREPTHADQTSILDPRPARPRSRSPPNVVWPNAQAHLQGPVTRCGPSPQSETPLAGAAP